MCANPGRVYCRTKIKMDIPSSLVDRQFVIPPLFDPTTMQKTGWFRVLGAFGLALVVFLSLFLWIASRFPTV